MTKFAPLPAPEIDTQLHSAVANNLKSPACLLLHLLPEGDSSNPNPINRSQLIEIDHSFKATAGASLRPRPALSRRGNGRDDQRAQLILVNHIYLDKRVAFQENSGWHASSNDSVLQKTVWAHRECVAWSNILSLRLLRLLLYLSLPGRRNPSLKKLWIHMQNHLSL